MEKRLSKEEYAEQQKQIKNELFELANNVFLDTVSDPKKYLHYLDVQSNTTLAPVNVMIGMGHFEHFQDAHELKTWQRMGKAYVKSGEHAFNILKGENNGEYTYYKLVKVFEASQLSVCPKKENPKLTLDEMVRALTLNSRVDVKVDHNTVKTVMYDREHDLIVIAKNGTESELIHGLAKAYCEEHLWKDYECEEDTLQFLSNSAAYMVCKRLGIEMSDTSFADCVVDDYKGFETSEIRTDMEAITETYKEISQRIDKVIADKNKNKEQEPQR